MDILGKHRAPDLTEVVDLGNNMSVRRRRQSRPRRAAVGARPFDAREMLLQDQTQPLSSWRASSLFVLLMDGLSAPPRGSPSDRQKRTEGILGIISELEDRGFNAEGYMRTIGAQAVASAISVCGVISLVNTATEGVNGAAEDEDLEAWGHLIFDDALSLSERRLKCVEQGPEWVRAQIDDLNARRMQIINAVAASPMPDIAGWEAPPASALDSPPQPPGGGINLWIHTRFAKSYLADWSVGSLHREWDYQHGRIAAPCQPQQMACRSIPSDVLDREIAQRSVEGTNRPPPLIDTNLYVLPAVEMLKNDRHASAAAVFEAITKIVPGDPYAHNNLGFCLIPSDLGAAMVELEKAAKLGLGNYGPNVGNRMLVLGTNRATTALALAERYHQNSPSTPQGAYMWECGGSDDYKLIFVNDIRVYVFELAFTLAEQAGDTSQARLWAQRVQALRSTE